MYAARIKCVCSRSTLERGAARSHRAASKPLLPPQAAGRSIAETTSPLTWYVTSAYRYRRHELNDPCASCEVCWIASKFLCCSQVNVRARRCLKPGCTKQPSFGKPGGRARFCKEHKSADMVCHSLNNCACTRRSLAGNLQYFSAQVNVSTWHCQESLCSKRASFASPGGRPQYCSDHKSADMVSHQCMCISYITSWTPCVRPALHAASHEHSFVTRR